MHIKYSQRCWKVEGNKFYYIQPFCDVKLKVNNYELVLDNCAFIESIKNDSAIKGANIIPQIGRVNINPWLALSEQWLSNPSFYRNRLVPECKMMNDFLKVSNSIGIDFPWKYTQLMFQSLKKNEVEIKSDLALLFSGLAYLKFILDEKDKFDKKLKKWLVLTNESYPKFSALIILGVLAIYFQSNRGLKFEDTQKVIYSFFDSFFSYKKKEGNTLTLSFLRNRAADLHFWYSFPQIYQGNDNNPEKSLTPIAVTADKFIASIPFKLIPFTRTKEIIGDKRFSCRFSPEALDKHVADELIDILKNIDLKTKTKKTVGEKKESLRKLYKLALEQRTDIEKNEIINTWEEWLGYDRSELKS